MIFCMQGIKEILNRMLRKLINTKENNMRKRFTKNTLEELKKIGEWQYQAVYKDKTINVEAALLFKAKGKVIINPFRDENQSKEVEPLEYYGDMFLKSPLVRIYTLLSETYEPETVFEMLTNLIIIKNKHYHKKDSVKEKTPFTINGDPLYVDDILSHYSGFMGYYKVSKGDNQFWLKSCIDEDEEEEAEEDELLCNLGSHWNKVEIIKEKYISYFSLRCDCCDKIIGLIVGDECIKISNSQFGGNVHIRGRKGKRCVCKDCLNNGEALENIKNPRKELAAYYYQKQTECGVVTLTNPSVFNNREEVDTYFEIHERVFACLDKAMRDKELKK